MHTVALISTLALMARGALSMCTLNGVQCVWVGTGPFCGYGNGNGAPSGQYAGWVPITSTETDNLGSLQDGNQELGNCAADYGARCITGYKVLYCDYNAATAQQKSAAASSEQQAAAAHHEDHQKSSAVNSNAGLSAGKDNGDQDGMIEGSSSKQGAISEGGIRVPMQKRARKFCE